MNTSDNRSRRASRRIPACRHSGSYGPPDLLEALECRLAMSAFSFESYLAHYGYDRPQLEVVAPVMSPGGFGSALAGLGDINADGVPDFAVAAPGLPDGSDAGSVYLYSGATAELIRTLSDGHSGFGVSLAAMNDVNSDGVPDLAIGSPRFGASPIPEDEPTGTVWVYSGADGTVIHQLIGEAPLGEFGAAVVALPEASGPMSLAVGAPNDSATGRVYRFAGDTGTQIAMISGAEGGERFGAVLGAAPAWIGFGSGSPLLAIGAPNFGAAAGRVVLIDRTHAVISAPEGGAGDELGSSLAFLRAASGSGYLLLAGAPGAGVPGLENAGFVRAMPRIQGVLDGFEAPNPTPGARFGAFLADVGDVTGDGINDVMVGAPGAGERYFVSSTARFDINDGFNASFPIPASILPYGAPIGDLDDDGVADLLTSDASGHVTVVSSAMLSTSVSNSSGGTSFPRVSGATRDGRSVWVNGGSRPMLLHDGVITPYSRIPTFLVSTPGNLEGPFSEIIGIGSDGVILYRNNDSELTTDPAPPRLLLPDGTDGPIESFFITIDGGPGNLMPVVENLHSAALSDNGRFVLLRESLPQLLEDHVWLLDLASGALTYLWDGEGADVNSSGVVVGTRAGTPSQAVRRSSDGVISVIAGLGMALAVNEQGDVLGRASPGFEIPQYVIVTADEFIEIGLPTVNGLTITYTVLDFDEQHEALVRVSVSGGHPPTTHTTHLYRPDTGFFSPLDDLSHGQGLTPVGSGNSFEFAEPGHAVLLNDGSILSYTALLTPIDEVEVYTLRPGSPLATVSGANGDYVAGINRFDELVVIRSFGGAHAGQRISLNVSDSAEFVIFADPQVAFAVYVVLSDAGLTTVFTDLGGAVATFAQLHHLSVFTSPAGVAHLVGLTPDGHLHMVYRTGGQFAVWTAVDLTADHLDPQNLATPQFVSGFAPLIAPWGAIHFAGLDLQGRVQAVWWAPGMTLWRVDDISAATGTPGTPVLTGRLTAFATPWGTLHYNAVDSTGVMTALWWAPSFAGVWVATPLLSGGLPVNPDSLDSYVTPWGGLTITGLDPEGRAAVYWWSAESDGWHADPIALRPPPDALPTLDTASRPVARSLPSSPQNLIVRRTDGHVIRLFWNVGDQDLWNLQDLSALV